MKRALDPHIETLLGAERARKGPSAAKRARVRARVSASILLPVTHPVPHAPPPPVPPPLGPAPLPPLHPASIWHAASVAYAALGPVARGIVVALSITGAGVGFGVATNPRPPATETKTIAEPRVLAPHLAPGGSGGDRVVLSDPVPTPDPEIASPPPSPPPAAATHPVPAPGARALEATDSVRGASASKPAATAETLAAERALLDEARGALRGGDAPKALRDLDLHAARFPAGVLLEERDAMIVQALVVAGRVDDARAAGARFRAAHRGSLLEATVDDALQSIP